MVQLFNQFLETEKLKSLQLHHSQKMADYSKRCLWCRENVVPLRVDEHPGASMGCFMDIFKCDSESVCLCVREWQIYREICKQAIWTPQRKRHERRFLFLFCDLARTGYCYVLPICIGTFLFQTWLMSLCVLCMCVRISFSLTVLQLPICLFSVEAVNVHGFLSIILSASTALGLNSVA